MNFVQMLLAVVASTSLFACGGSQETSSSNVDSLAGEFGAAFAAPYQVICDRCGADPAAGSKPSFGPVLDLRGPNEVSAAEAVVKAVRDQNLFGKSALVCGKIDGRKIHIGSKRFVTNTPTCPVNVR